MDELNSIDAQEFADALKQVVGPASAQKRRAIVQQVDVDGTVWVQMPGSDKLVPISGSSAAVSPGDTVTAEFRGGALYVEGNASDPATGARHTDTAIRKAVKPIVADIAKAREAADEAQAVADATNQHFFADGSGVHVTEAEGDATTEHNILINSLGILLRKATNYLVSITQSAIAFYDGLGNNAANIVAQFGASGAQIGRVDESHVAVENDTFSMFGADGSKAAMISSSTRIGDPINRYEEFIRMPYDTASQQQRVQWAVGDVFDYTVSPINDFSIGDLKIHSFIASSGITQTIDSLPFSGNLYYKVQSGPDIGTRYDVADIDITAMSGGYMAVHIEVTRATSVAYLAIEYNYQSIAPAYDFGIRKPGTGYGKYSLIEGYNAQASGEASHAQNLETVAASDYQTAMGKYNEEDDADTYALIVGNGTADNARSNAAALQWDGTLELAKPLPVSSGGTGTTAFGTHYAPTMGATKSVANNTWTQLHNFKLAAGKWLVLAYLYAASNTTGSRQYRLTKSSTAPTTVSLDGDSLVLAGGNSAVYAVLPVFVEHSAETTYYMWATQNSGGALNMRANLTAIRLG